ncbi:hypothetical protein LX36DRAFT_745392 [Colletotrichum falcatum]|nr:hypothetical protein LX36DRAFT_745392 [Colletotrichum falcatum]
MTDPPVTLPGSRGGPETTNTQANVNDVSPLSIPSRIASSATLRHTRSLEAKDEHSLADVDDVSPQSTPSSFSSVVSDHSQDGHEQAHEADVEVSLSPKPAYQGQAEIPPSRGVAKMAVTQGEMEGIFANWLRTRAKVSIRETFHWQWAEEQEEPDSVEEAVLHALCELPNAPMVSDIYHLMSTIRRQTYDGFISRDIEDIGVHATDFFVLVRLWGYFHKDKKPSECPWMENRPHQMEGSSDDGFHSYKRLLEQRRTSTEPRGEVPAKTPPPPVPAAFADSETKKAAPPPAPLGKIPLQGYGQRKSVAPPAPPAPAKVAQGSKYPPPNRADHPWYKMIRSSTSLRQQAWSRYRGGPEHDPSELPFEVCFKDKAVAKRLFWSRPIIDDVNAMVRGHLKFLYQRRGEFVCLVLSPDPKAKLADVYQRLIMAWELAMDCKRQGEGVGSSGLQRRYPSLSEYFRNNWTRKIRGVEAVCDSTKGAANEQLREKAKSSARRVAGHKRKASTSLSRASQTDRPAQGFPPRLPPHPQGAMWQGQFPGQQPGGFWPHPSMAPAYGAAPMGPAAPWPNAPGQGGPPAGYGMPPMGGWWNMGPGWQ